MAQMIPERLPANASNGELKMFSILQKLSDDCIVYYENNRTGSYIDFTVISPELGLIIIEVKGWRAREIIKADSNDVLVNQFGKEQVQKHPTRQAREYMFKLMDFCSQHPNCQSLLHAEGKRKGRFLFPFTHFSVLSWITSEDLAEHQLDNLLEIFPKNKVVSRDTFLSWQDDSVTSDDLVEILRGFFDPIWSFERLSETQINAIRGMLHPESNIPATPSSIAKSKRLKLAKKAGLSVKQLDLKQEQNAKSIGQGHRIIYGVAGSGKTIILIARAKIASLQNPEANILLLCYNVVLAFYLKETLAEYPNVNIKHFDDWCKSNRVTRLVDRSSGMWESESDEAIGERMLAALQQGSTESAKYDVVMIDEAQDFHPIWYSCALEGMKDPYDGDLIIVGDASQGLYSRSKINWKQIGINARGRTIHRKFDLDRNYRNSREILDMAAIFANSGTENDDDNDINAIGSPIVDPQKCIRKTGLKPILFQSKNRQEECDRVVQVVEDLLSGSWFDDPVGKIVPEDIGIFYPLALKKDKPILRSLIDNLNKIAPTVWLNENSDSRTKVCNSGIKVQTIHSAKGLQYKVVIILWTDLLPTRFPNSTESDDRKLLYVGLTRAEDFLAISYSSPSRFITQIQPFAKDRSLAEITL